MQPVSVINLADLIAGVKHERIAGKPLISKKCHIVSSAATTARQAAASPFSRAANPRKGQSQRFCDPRSYDSPVSGSNVMCGIMVAFSFRVTRPAMVFGSGFFGVKASVLSTSS